MVSAISSAGSSGIDVNAVVKALMDVERIPITKLNAKESADKAKISAYGAIKGYASSFQSSVKALLSSSSSSAFSTFKATSSDTTTLSASASSTAAAGTYAVSVTTLAQSQKLVAVGQTTKTTAISDGVATTITFDFGTISGGTLSGGAYTGATFTSNGAGTHDVVIDGTNNTLEGIRNAINAGKFGVTASIVNDGSGTPYRLTLSSDKSGVSNSIKITTSGGDGTINTLLGHDPGAVPASQHLNQTVASQNAVFTVNGVSITKTSNTVSDAIEGVSLTLSKEASSANLTVVRDSTAVIDAVKNFVKSYNDLYGAAKTNSAYKANQVLEGDSTLRSIMSGLRSIASGVVTGGTLANFYEVGVTFTAAGVMQFDSAKLDGALATNIEDVTNLFNATDGYATKFDAYATTTIGLGGTISTRLTNIEDRIKRIGLDRDALEVRMKRLEQNYRAQFSNLNILLSSMSQTSSYLSQQLG